MVEIEKLRAEFVKVYKENIKREGADKLLDWLTKSDFFIAPSSTKFHSSFEGGLCLHSLGAYKRFKSLVLSEFGQGYAEIISDESIAIIALLHDICKVNFYKQDMRNVKVNGVWEQQPYYSVEEELPYGHGEKSVYIASSFIKLTREEAMAINWHMGGFDSRVTQGSYTIANAYYKFPIAVLFHAADVLTTYLDEERKS